MKSLWDIHFLGLFCFVRNAGADGFFYISSTRTQDVYDFPAVPPV